MLTSIIDKTRKLTFHKNEKVIAKFSDNLEYEAEIIKITSPLGVHLLYDDGIKKNQKLKTIRKIQDLSELEKLKSTAEKFYETCTVLTREEKNQIDEKYSFEDEMVDKNTLNKRTTRSTAPLLVADTIITSTAITPAGQNDQNNNNTKNYDNDITVRKTRSGKIINKLNESESFKNIPSTAEINTIKKLKNNLTEQDMKRPSSEILSKLANDRFETSSFITVKTKVSFSSKHSDNSFSPDDHDQEIENLEAEQSKGNAPTESLNINKNIAKSHVQKNLETTDQHEIEKSSTIASFNESSSEIVKPFEDFQNKITPQRADISAKKMLDSIKKFNNEKDSDLNDNDVRLTAEMLDYSATSPSQLMSIDGVNNSQYKHIPYEVFEKPKNYETNKNTDVQNGGADSLLGPFSRITSCESTNESLEKLSKQELIEKLRKSEHKRRKLENNVERVYKDMVEFCRVTEKTLKEE